MARIAFDLDETLATLFDFVFLIELFLSSQEKTPAE